MGRGSYFVHQSEKPLSHTLDTFDMPPQPIIVQGTEAVLAYLKDQHDLKATVALSKKDANKKDRPETAKEGANTKKYNNTKNKNEYQSMTKGF